ncbi:MAG: hypothetical protein AAFX05_08265 [Planctomycetota bacterium]
MDPYIETTGDYESLQSPADTLDGGENGSRFPSVAPGQIRDRRDVWWGNISYMFIAGIRTDLGSPVALIGDESNAVDAGNLTGGGTVDNYLGTLRAGAPTLEERGYQDVDNHGASGGNFAFTDAHVEWIASQRSEDGSLEPNTTLFAETIRILRRKAEYTDDNPTALIQTID